MATRLPLAPSATSIASTLPPCSENTTWCSVSAGSPIQSYIAISIRSPQSSGHEIFRNVYILQASLRNTESVSTLATMRLGLLPKASRVSVPRNLGCSHRSFLNSVVSLVTIGFFFTRAGIPVCLSDHDELEATGSTPLGSIGLGFGLACYQCRTSCPRGSGKTSSRRFKQSRHSPLELLVTAMRLVHQPLDVSLP